jgi:1-acyl-sn-glycerol-3-phosphate acyltransferase
VSWLDIFVINTLQPCRFVAKADIREWPLLGWLCAKAGTIFIARGKLRAVRRIFEYVVTTIRDGELVAFFPEGTTAAQGALLPFHSNLFEAAIDAAVPIQPVAVRYLDSAGQLAPQANFIGETTFAESLLTILRSEKLSAQLIVLPVIDTTGAHRRELAAQAQSAINTALGYPSGD